MSIAKLEASRSEDINLHVGSCISNNHGILVGSGHRVFAGNSKEKFIQKLGNEAYRDNYIIHAESHAICNKTVDSLQDCTIYTTLYPCVQCAKIICQHGIKRVVYSEVKEGCDTKEQEIMFEMAGVAVAKFI